MPVEKKGNKVTIKQAKEFTSETKRKKDKDKDSNSPTKKGRKG